MTLVWIPLSMALGSVSVSVVRRRAAMALYPIHRDIYCNCKKEMPRYGVHPSEEMKGLLTSHLGKPVKQGEKSNDLSIFTPYCTY